MLFPSRTAILTFGMLVFVDWEKEAKIAKQRQDEQQALDALKKGEGGRPSWAAAAAATGVGSQPQP